jgi:succinate-semialdehyde dehydrogenase/glutarate-semialdehyde dehydrogenase
MPHDERPFRSLNPATEELVARFDFASEEDLEARVAAAAGARRSWAGAAFAERARPMRELARLLREERPRLASLVTMEMGKPIREAQGEIEKCAWVCDHYAEHAAGILADQPHASGATESYVAFAPLGTVLAIMPWNFPFWQLLRFAAPALMAGNIALLKHAPNVPQCAMAAEDLFRRAGFPAAVFANLMISGRRAGELIADPRIAAVTLTGSDAAGASVGEQAGRHVKKAVLELGGSDAFIVLEDADLNGAVDTGIRARFQNGGQSCIAAKRFLVCEAVFAEFRDRFAEATRNLVVGDPTDEATQIGPLARDDLRQALERQIERSVASGARVIAGGRRKAGRGYYFLPTVLDDVSPEMPVAREEVFGPVAPLFKVRNADEAVALANDSPYGLGCSLFTRDLDRARSLAGRIEAGSVFINGMVASDPRLPFGGVKRSGYGRELSEYGIRELVNVQTVWIGPKKD